MRPVLRSYHGADKPCFSYQERGQRGQPTAAIKNASCNKHKHANNDDTSDLTRLDLTR